MPMCMRRVATAILLLAACLHADERSPSEISKRWPLEDFAGLVRWVRARGDITPEQQSQLLRSRAIDLCNQRFDLAAAGLRLLTEQERSGTLTSLYARKLALRDLSSGAMFMTEQRTPAATADAMEGLIETWVRTDLVTVREMAANWPDMEQRDRLIWLVVWEWARIDARAAADWCARLAAPLRERALGECIHYLRYSAPEEAYARILALPAGEERDRIALRVIRDVIAGPEVAAGWICGYPDRIVAARLMRELGSTQGRSIYLGDARAEAEAINTWIDAIDDLSLREAACEGAIDGLLGNYIYPNPPKDPAVFRTLIEPVRNPALQAALIAKVKSTWRKRFPDTPLDLGLAR